MRCRYCMPEGSTSGCRATRSSRSRRSIAWRAFSAALGVERSGSRAGSRCCATSLPALVRLLGRHEPIRRHRAHHQRHPARPPRRRASRGGPPARDGEPGHARGPSGWWRSPGARATPTCSTGIAAASAAGFEPSSSIGGHPRTTTTTNPRPARVRPRAGSRDPLHRVHGRGRRDALGHGPRWSRSARSSNHRRSLRAGDPLHEDDWAPAERFRLPDGTTFGVIASTTAPFCRTCDRSRLTADGTFLLCLYGERGLDLRELLRAGASDEEIAERIGRRGPRAPIAAPRSERHSPTAACCTRSRASAPIRGARCTRAAADGAPRRAHPTPDPPEHGQHRPAVRGHGHAAPPHRAAGFLASSPRGAPRGPRLLGQGGPLGRTRTGTPSATPSAGIGASTSPPTPRTTTGTRRSGSARAGVRQRDRGHADADSGEASGALLSHSDARGGPKPQPGQRRERGAVRGLRQLGGVRAGSPARGWRPTGRDRSCPLAARDAEHDSDGHHRLRGSGFTSPPSHTRATGMLEKVAVVAQATSAPPQRSVSPRRISPAPW